jgi:hypothetical protein
MLQEKLIIGKEGKLTDQTTYEERREDALFNEVIV